MYNKSNIKAKQNALNKQLSNAVYINFLILISRFLDRIFLNHSFIITCSRIEHEYDVLQY